MITLDTSGLLALFDRKDPFHAACLATFRADSGPAIISAAILSEVGWFLADRRRFSSVLEVSFLGDLVAGAYEVDWNTADLERIAILVDRYNDLPLGIADASVIARAERHGGLLLSTDRHFASVIERDPTVRIRVLPADA